MRPAAAVPPAVLDVARRLRARPPRAGSTRVVAVDGRSGAGKSTFARALAAHLGAPTVELEALYGGWDGLRDGTERLAHDVLATLATQGRLRVPDFDWHRDAWNAPWELAAPPLLVVEGVGAGARAAAPWTSLLVWLELDDAERRRRALVRDGGRFDAHWDAWAAQEEELLEAEGTRARADLVVPGDDEAVGAAS